MHQTRGDSSQATGGGKSPAALPHTDDGVDPPDYPRPIDGRSESPWSPFTLLACAWIAGLLLGAWIDLFWLWCGAGVIALVVAAIRGRTRAGTRHVAIFFAIMCAAAAWGIVRWNHLPASHINSYLTLEAQLAQVTGTIDSPVNVTQPQRGPMADFSYLPPATMFVIALDSITIDDQPQPIAGRLLVKIKQTDLMLREGDRVRLIGWMGAIDGPSNPGEMDFRAIMASREVDGRLTLNLRDNCRMIQRGSLLDGATLRSRIAAAAHESLHIGLHEDRQRRAFLDTLLLGRWSSDLGELNDAFRNTGLTHILSISGAHLTMLMGLIWCVVRLIWPHPRRAAIIVLCILGLYMLAVPWRVPIVRAGLMAALLCLGLASGRRVRGIDMIALSAVIVLIWRPQDLFNAGAQLSYIVVAALILFTQPVSQWLWPDPLIIPPAEQFRHALTRRTADYLAVNLVAFVVAAPLVAFHFRMVSPLAMLLTLVAIPVITLVLGLGYLKILVGLALPSAGLVLAGPLEWSADIMTGLVRHASNWPASSMPLATAPSAVWLIGTLSICLAWLAGWFTRRKLALSAGAIICGAWLLLPHHPRVAEAVDRIRSQPAMTINMFAVGDGSCFLIRLNDGVEHHILFDCGSQQYLDLGERSIIPALRALHVSRIDTLIISHADMDHFAGVPDLVEASHVRRVLLPPHLKQEAESDPQGAAGQLMAALAKKQIPIETPTRGWNETRGNAQLDMLWPPADWSSERANDTSLVLSIRAGGKRLLLNGDLDRLATPALLKLNDDLRADITDLPHHGSFVPDSPRWLGKVAPRFVLQSSGPARLRNDKWAALLADPSITRLVTALRGMIELRVAKDGTITWSAFRELPQAIEP
ncbi:MAG: ComEC/Rec2 family competence protein [Phycisphaeraceae bacterium]